MIRELFRLRRVSCVRAICGLYATVRDERARGLGLPVAAAGLAGRGAYVDGAGPGPRSCRAGRGVSGVPAGAAGLAEHGEVLRAGARAVLGVPRAVRALLGPAD